MKKTLTGIAFGNVDDLKVDHKHEYWTIELRKTSSKGSFRDHLWSMTWK